MKTVEKTLSAALVIVLLIAAVGMILQNKIFIFVAMGVLVAVTAAFAAWQAVMYFRVGDGEQKPQLWLTVVSFAVLAVAVVLAVLIYSGVLFNL